MALFILISLRLLFILVWTLLYAYVYIVTSVNMLRLRGCDDVFYYFDDGLVLVWVSCRSALLSDLDALQCHFSVKSLAEVETAMSDAFFRCLLGLVGCHRD